MCFLSVKKSLININYRSSSETLNTSVILILKNNKTKINKTLKK